MKCKYALDEADERGWFPLHEAAAQPVQQILEVILDGKSAQNDRMKDVGKLSVRESMLFFP